MSTWIRLASLAVGLVAASVGAAVWRWRVVTTRALRRLGGRPSGPTPCFSPDAVHDLPEPVSRYFAFALPAGQPLPSRAEVEQEGELLMAGGKWKPFRAVNHITVRPPGFVWDATVSMAPLVPVRVRDSYLHGEGAMRGAVAALIPVVTEGGTPEMAAASLQRYLAEGAWMPSALLPGAGVTWAPIDDSSARATLEDHGITVYVDFRFAPTGEIVGTSTERYRSVDGAQVLTPWVGQFGDYGRLDGLMVPRTGQVGWAPSGKTLPYWRGRATAIRFGGSP
jgi:Family of unknown function (DUF6920)